MQLLETEHPLETHTAENVATPAVPRLPTASRSPDLPIFRGDDLVSLVCAIAKSEYDLTPMELEVARMRMLGWQRDAIATHLHRSTHTIDSHLKMVRRKLGAASAAALFKAAVETLNRRVDASSDHRHPL